MQYNNQNNKNNSVSKDISEIDNLNREALKSTFLIIIFSILVALIPLAGIISVETTNDSDVVETLDFRSDIKIKKYADIC